MKNLKWIIILLILTIKTGYSQTLSITEVQRDSIYSKIIRGQNAIENNKILKLRIVSKDSVIKLKTEMIGILQIDMGLKDQQITALNSVISNQENIIKNEKKRGRRKGFYGFLKGVGIGAVGVLLLTL